MKKTFSLVVFAFVSISGYGQCAMCKAAVESNGEASTAAGLNAGILYLMFIPYLLIAGIAFFVIRHKRRLKQNEGA
jgi:hypothetical protein